MRDVLMNVDRILLMRRRLPRCVPYEVVREH